MKYSYVKKCPISKYFIEYIIDDELKIAYLNLIICDYKQIKYLLSLIRISIDELSVNKINKIRQTVTYIEWKKYLQNKTSWKIINDDKINEIYDIECLTSDFLKNYGIGIGLL